MVSIIVTHKKDTLYLKDCLESIAEQQFKDYETILVVDHTEDNIEPLIEEFKDKINLKVFYLEDKHVSAVQETLVLIRQQESMSISLIMTITCMAILLSYYWT